MTTIYYTEDIFIDFYYNCCPSLFMPDPVRKAASDFVSIIEDNRKITRSQSFYILRILKTYSKAVDALNYEYTVALSFPKWKNEFRTLDTSRRIWVEDTKVCLKFPYQIKDTVYSVIHNIRYDVVRQLYFISLHKINKIHLLTDLLAEFHFEIDESFDMLVGEVEDIWNNYDLYNPYSTIINNQVHIINGAQSADDWWKTNATGNVNSDLLLAKNMGFQYTGNAVTMFEKIAAAPTNLFWMSDASKFLDLAMTSTGKTCVVLDRASDSLAWIQLLVETAKVKDIPISNIKVCIRSQSQLRMESYIKEHSLNNNWSDAKIIIFVYRPNKWFAQYIDEVSVLATNQLYPSTNSLTKDWMESHPCVVHLETTKPSIKKDKHIVNL